MLSAYKQAVQFCGPDTDAQKQAALAAYNADVISMSPGASNVTSVNDTSFLSWASVQYAPLIEVLDECSGAEADLDDAEKSVAASVTLLSATPSSDSLGPTNFDGSGTSPTVPTTLSGSHAGEPTSSDSGKGIGHTYPLIGPLAVFVGLLIVLS